MFGREVRVPLDLAFGEPPVEEGCGPVYDEYVEEKRNRMRKSFDLVRQNLGVAAARRKERYDLKVKPNRFEVGEYVWYYYPRKLVGKSAKWQAAYQGPFLVVDIINPVNYVIQKSPRANRQVVHVDKLKRCYFETPSPWTTGRPEQPDEQSDGAIVFNGQDGVEQTERDVATTGEAEGVARDESENLDAVSPSPVREATIAMNTGADASSPDVDNAGDKYVLRRREKIRVPVRYR
jgi:hypothetical protein